MSEDTKTTTAAPRQVAKVTLRDDAACALWLRLFDNGSLEIDGYGNDKTTAEFWGGDYEWHINIKTEDVGGYLALIGKADADDVLGAVAEAYAERSEVVSTRFLDAHEVEYSFFSWSG